MIASANTCCGETENGAPCRAQPRTGSKFCFFHDPDAEGKRREARRAGGVSRSKPLAVLPPETPDLPLRSVHDVGGLLADTINRVRKGDMDPRIANSVGYLSGVMLKALETADIERRLAALENAAAAQRTDALPRFDPRKPILPTDDLPEDEQ